MKKLLVVTISVIFVLALGTAYAESANGVTDFSGGTYESLGSVPAEATGSLMEDSGSGAGGLRDSAEIANGVTDFSGGTYESLGSVPAEATGSLMEDSGSGAGGLRDSDEIANGITDFSGRTYESLGAIHE
ncbi:MAG TPA: hypothetical protein VEI57_06520 [Nitrospirota bacterium]|nr:hypothetical protein [Nitrospirota bacterium]